MQKFVLETCAGFHQYP